jgi:glycosyltransferase involved in cell wall biosynthesis
MRVAVDATSLYDPMTGVGRVTAELLAGTAARSDVEVVAFAVTWRGRERLADLVPAGVTTADRWPMAAGPLRALWRRAEHPRIERWTGTVDVVHGPNFVVPPARAARVVTVHDLTAVHWPELCTPDVRRYPALLRRALDRGAWVHTPSEHVRHEVIDVLGAPPERVVAIPNGLRAAPPGDPAQGRALAGSDRYVLAVGTVEPRKDLPLLVAAFDLLAGEDQDVALVVAGPDGWGVDAYRAAVDATAHRDRIVRLGYVDEATRGHLLAGAAALALPSRYEGFGLTAGEAMLAGTPVVACRAGAVPEVVGDAGLLVDVGDRDGLAAALARVLDDGDLAEDLRRRGPERAAAFTWEAACEAVLGLWARAGGGPRGAR